MTGLCATGGVFGIRRAHEPLGEVGAADAEPSGDTVDLHLYVEEDPSWVRRGRLCVCKHCLLVYFEPSEPPLTEEPSS